MTVRKGATRPGSSRQIRGERMKDEVYRQMFLLEESRPGAELGLALALLRAWLFADQKPAGDEGRQWLRKVSPICLKMIEAALLAADTAHPRMQ
ncbi:MAG: hypothetical protein WBA18_10490 [Terracidiphilus sp.]